jgi:hypothetical protein
LDGPGSGRRVRVPALTIEKPLLRAAIQSLPHDGWQPPGLFFVRDWLALAAPAQGVASPIFDGWSIFIH